MPHGMTNIALIGKETVRGTPVAGAMTVPLIGDGLKIGFTQHQGRILASSTFPSITDIVALGLTPAVRLALDLNVATVRDIILMAWKRDATTKELSSFTFLETSMGVGSQQAAGGVCRSLELSFSRSDAPNETALLSAAMEFAAMNVSAATGVTAGTYGAGRRFKLAKSTFTINSVAALEVLSFSWRLTNTLHIGPHDGDGKVMYIEDGIEEHEFTLTARFATEAWRNLVKNATEHACTFMMDAGGSNERVSLDIGKAQVQSHELSGGAETVTEQIVIVPFHTGTLRPVVPTFGAGIGASVLGL